MTRAATGPPAATPRGAPLRRARDDAWAQRLGIGTLVALLGLFVAAPTLVLLARSLGDDGGAWVGPRNFARYFSTPRLLESLRNTAVVVTASLRRITASMRAKSSCSPNGLVT